MLIAVLGLIAASAWWMSYAQAGRSDRVERLRKRFRLPESDERVPLYDDRDRRERSSDRVEPPAHVPAAGSMNAILRSIEEAERSSDEAPGAGDGSGVVTPLIARRPPPQPVHLPGPAEGTLGRVVHTADGEMILSTPPFAARQSIFSEWQGRYVIELSRRLPAWIVVCPRVRLDALVKPTPPDGRDAADWREWRRRVRWRAVDVLLCDGRTWRPVLALEIGRPHLARDIRTPGGGNDRILEEVFFAVGIPFLRGSGVVSRDWPLVRPYVDEAILSTRDPCVEGDGGVDRGGSASGLLDLLGEGLVAEGSDGLGTGKRDGDGVSAVDDAG